MEEIWKPVVGYEQLYLISNLENAKSIRRNKLLKPFKCTNGYMQYRLSKNGQSKNVLIHRMVAKAFISNLENKPQVNHKNGIREDNTLDNLEWCTLEENTIDKVARHKKYPNVKNKYKYYKSKNRIYKKSNRSKRGQPIRVKQYNLKNELVKEWNSIKEASYELKINQGNIVNCCKQKRKTAGNYIWKYCS